MFLRALFLERVQLHQVTVVLLNILAVVKHKVFCAVSGFRHSRKPRPQSNDEAASVLAGAVIRTFVDRGCFFFFFFFSLRTLRMIHFLVSRDIKVQIFYLDAFLLHDWQVAYLHLTAADRGCTAFFFL